MTIGEKCFDKVEDVVEICNYSNLEKIVVKKNSMKNLTSLKICNNENLNTIEVDENTFYNVNTVIIESIS